MKRIRAPKSFTGLDLICALCSESNFVQHENNVVCDTCGVFKPIKSLMVYLDGVTGDKDDQDWRASIEQVLA
jgi:hypothetical protein